MMPAALERVIERTVPAGGGGGGRLSGRRGYGGGGDNQPEPREPDAGGLGRLGMWVALVPILMLFAGFCAAYILRRGIAGDWKPVALPPILWLNTALLVLSSLALEQARRALRSTPHALLRARAGRAADGRLGLTVSGMAGELGVDTAPGRGSGNVAFLGWWSAATVLGMGFLAGQLTAWTQLARYGVFPSANPAGSFFFLLTAAHALHLAGGEVALLYIATQSLRGRLASLRTPVDVTRIYWHFLGVLWAALFGLLRFWR